MSKEEAEAARVAAAKAKIEDAKARRKKSRENKKERIKTGQIWYGNSKWADGKPKVYKIGKEREETTDEKTQASTPKRKPKPSKADSKPVKKSQLSTKEKPWCLYILCSLEPKYPNGTYVGISNDVRRRENTHNNTMHGAYITRLRRPWICAAYIQGFPDQRACMNAERTLKSVNRSNSKNFSGPLGRMKSIIYCLTKLERWTPSYVNEIKDE